jgi:hypothetical protein
MNDSITEVATTTLVAERGCESAGEVIFQKPAGLADGLGVGNPLPALPDAPLNSRVPRAAEAA